MSRKNVDSSSGEDKRKRTKKNHPTTSEMVIAAIATLKDRTGSSLQAIRKYIANTYESDSDLQYRLIKKFLKSAVEDGLLIHTTGRGASGSFKLSPAYKETDKKKKKAENKMREKKEQNLEMKTTAKDPKKVIKKAVKEVTAKVKKSMVKKKVSSPTKAKLLKVKTSAASKKARKSLQK